MALDSGYFYDDGDPTDKQRRKPMEKEKKKDLRKILVRPQTLYHLQIMAMQMGVKYPGQVVDKLMREKMI